VDIIFRISFFKPDTKKAILALKGGRRRRGEGGGRGGACEFHYSRSPPQYTLIEKHVGVKIKEEKKKGGGGKRKEGFPVDLLRFNLYVLPLLGDEPVERRGRKKKKKGGRKRGGDVGLSNGEIPIISVLFLLPFHHKREWSPKGMRRKEERE